MRERVVLEVRDLSFGYTDVPVLERVSFGVREGGVCHHCGSQWGRENYPSAASSWSSSSMEGDDLCVWKAR